MKIIELTFCFLALSSALPTRAVAEPVLEEPPNGLSVPRAITEMYQENRKMRVKPTYSQPEWSFDGSTEAATVEGELVSAQDGTVMLSFPVVPEMKASMLERGTVEVMKKEELANDVIFDGRWYRTFYATADATGLGELEVDRLVGRQVRVELKLTMTGRYLVSSLRDL